MGIGGVFLCILLVILAVFCAVLAAPLSYTVKAQTPKEGLGKEASFTARLSLYGIPLPYERFLADHKKNKGKKQAARPAKRAKFSLRNFYASINNAKRFFAYYGRLLTSEHGQEALHSILQTGREVLPRLLPKKWTIRGDVGFADPSLTGSVAGILAFLSRFTGKHLQVNLRFEEETLDLSAYAKGRIRVGTLLFAAWKLYRNPYLRKSLKALKAAPSPHGEMLPARG